MRQEARGPGRPVKEKPGLAARSDRHGQKLRWMRRTPDHTSLSWTRWTSGMPAGTGANGTVGDTPLALPPANAVSILEYMTSRPISRFVTGFQIVREPTCQAFQSAQPGPKPRGPQISVSTAELLAS